MVSVASHNNQVAELAQRLSWERNLYEYTDARVQYMHVCQPCKYVTPASQSYRSKQNIKSTVFIADILKKQLMKKPII